jgi:3-oxoadipate enol-lactonase
VSSDEEALKAAVAAVTPALALGADGVRLAYEEIGSGQPLVLISGQGGDRHAWDDTRADFADCYRVITFDHRGTGDSDKPEAPPYTTRGFARDVITILDSLSIARAHVYGISMGGRVAQWLAIDHPARVGALVLGCTTPGNAHGVRRPPEIDAQMASRPSDPEEALRAYIEALVTPQWAKSNPAWVEEQRQRFLHPLPGYVRRLHYLASEGHDAWDLLTTINAPTLVIHGGDDQVNPTANAPLLADRIPGAELHIIPGGRHGYFIECRAEASRVVAEFINRHPL